LKNFLKYYGVERVDGILADLGVSSHHLDDETRGFSFRFEGQLDMRMNTAAGKTAADVLNSYSEEELANVFYFYGELQQARKLAKAIVKARGEAEFDDIARFMEVVKPFFKHEREKKDLAKVFQALRIEVNKEMEVLKDMLAQVPEVFIEWSSAFTRWHQQSLGLLPKLSISIMNHLQQFLEKGNCWSIVPISVAYGLEQRCRIRRLETEFPMPKREVSFLVAPGSDKNTAILAFCDCLKDVVSQYPELEM
jgi:hypothetical protein